jgi:surface polysaccharide O-acyltransferase-like enzyme
VIVVMYKGFLAWTRMKPYDLWNILHDLTKSSASYLYFLVILAGLYLLIPLLQKVFDRTAKDDVLPKYLIGFFVANALLATLARYTSLRVGEVLSNTFTIWLPWVGYFLLGYWIREHLDALRKHTKKFFLAFSLAFFCTLFFGFLSWRMHWAGNEQWYMSGMTYPEEYLSVNVMVMSVSAFVLLMTVRIPEKVRQNQQLVRGLALLAELSFGVYLIHVLVIDILNNFFGITADNPAMPNLPTYVLINTALTVSISLALAWAARRIPLLQRLVGVVPKKA